MLNPRLSITQNIDELFFSETAPLREEYAFLFRSLFKDSPVYRRIVELLATKVKGMIRMEIMKTLKIADNGKFSEVLDNLCKCDFIRSYSAFGKKERDVLFQLVDLYSLFYVRYVKNDHSMDINRWSHTINDGARKAWSGYAFEQVCLRHVEQMKKKLRIEDILSDVSSWQIESAQIDLVIERKDRIINLCEMKYSDKPYSITKGYLKKMTDRRELFREETGTTKALHLTMVTPYGIKNNEQAKSIQSIITLDNLYE